MKKKLTMLDVIRKKIKSLENGDPDVFSHRLPSTYVMWFKDMVVPKEHTFIEINGEQFIRTASMTQKELWQVVKRSLEPIKP